MAELTNDQMKALRPGYDETNIPLGTPINVSANAPIDSRLVVANKQALTAADAFTSIYNGMLVTVEDTGEAYVYVGDTGYPDQTQTESNWKKVGDVSSLQSQIDTLNGGDTVNGSVDKKIKDASSNYIRLGETNLVTEQTELRGNDYASFQVSDGDGRGSKFAALHPNELELSYDSNSTAIILSTTNEKELCIGGENEQYSTNILGVRTPTKNYHAANKKYVDESNYSFLSSAKAYADEKVSSAYKIKGCKDNFTDLTEVGNQPGDVWNIKNAFTLDGKPYPAGTNVVWVEAHTDEEDADHASGWDALGGTIDLSPYLKIEDAGKNFKSKQTPVSKTGEVSKTLAISQNSNGEISVEALNIQIGTGQITGLDGKVTSAIDTAINKLDVSNNASDAVNGVTVTVNEVDGKVSKPVVAITPGKIESGIENLVTGGAVYSAIETAKTSIKGDVVVKNPGSVDAQVITGNITISGNYGLTTTDAVGKTSNVSPSQISVAKRTDGEDETNGEIIIGATSIVARDATDGQVITVERNSDYTGIKIDQDGADVHIEGVALPSKDNEAANKEYVDDAVSNVNVGVTRFGEKTGEIGINTTATTNGSVKFSMSGDKVLGGTVVGLGSAAYTASDNYATAAQGTKADGAVQLGKENNSGENATSFVVDTISDTGVIVKTKAGATISGVSKLSPRMLQIGEGQATRVIPGSIVLSNKQDEDVYISSPSAGHVKILSKASGKVTILEGIANPTDANDAANKSYVDSKVSSALTWEIV